MNHFSLVFLLAVACSKPKGSSVDPGTAAHPEIPPVEEVVDAPPLQRTPAELYAQCLGRVEGSDADGECMVDADCATGGCGSEVCTSAEEAKGMMTTCEQRACFAALDSCGCHQGKCQWSLKAADRMPPPLRRPVPQ